MSDYYSDNDYNNDTDYDVDDTGVDDTSPIDLDSIDITSKILESGSHVNSDMEQYENEMLESIDAEEVDNNDDTSSEGGGNEDDGDYNDTITSSVDADDDDDNNIGKGKVLDGSNTRRKYKTKDLPHSTTSSSKYTTSNSSVYSNGVAIESTRLSDTLKQVVLESFKTLSYYDFTNIVSMRYKQLCNGSITLASNVKGLSLIECVSAELEQRVCPLTIDKNAHTINVNEMFGIDYYLSQYREDINNIALSERLE